MQVAVIDEGEIAQLAEAISDACDGQHAILILVAISDLFYAIAEAQPGLTMDNILTDFVNVARQRHAANSSQALN